MFKRLGLIFFIFGLFFTFSTKLIFAEVKTEERITNFSSDIIVEQAGTILVTEKISVWANNDQINHGIYRDFPTVYKDKLGHNYKIDFTFISAKRNNLPENYQIKKLNNGFRIYLGQANVIILPGNYDYEITYRVNRELGFFADHDELYWNVTGSGWAFPIYTSEARVHLPTILDQNLIQTKSFNGAVGSKKSEQISVEFSQDSLGSVIKFVDQKTVSPGEDFTIVVGWPKGFVQPPTPVDQNYYWLLDNSSLLIGLLGLLIVFLYYIFVWNKYGRDPESKTIIAQYEPPKSISPSVMNYLLNRRFEDRGLVSEIIQLAVNGYLKIDKKVTNYTLTIANKNYDSDQILEPQKILLASIFNTSDSVSVGGQSRSLRNEKNILLKWLENNFKKDYFTKNIKYCVIGLILSLLVIMSVTFIDGGQELATVCFMSVGLSVWTVAIVTMVWQVIKSWINIFNSNDKTVGTISQAVISSIFLIPFMIGEFVAIFMVYNVVSFNFLLILSLFIILNITFYFLNRQYTRQGLDLVEQIKGFKLFLSVTEKDRMNFHNPPNRTPELFEKYLPYAVALGIENKWADQFTNVFTDPQYAGYHYSIYPRQIYNSNFIGDFSSSVASSTTPPSSSSGFSGGGGSGGGGGGGGGGGW